MDLSRRQFGCGLAALSAAALLGGRAQAAEPAHILRSWYSLILELVRQTPTYSPPVAARAFAYLGITTFEAVASGSKTLKSLAGQARGLANVPQRKPGVAYDDAVIVHAALAEGTQSFFGNTGPSGLRAIKALEKKLHQEVQKGLAPGVWEESTAYGKAVVEHIEAWSMSDGGGHVENLGFPDKYELTKGPAHWVPTSTIALQQAPLLPHWGECLPIAMPSNGACPLPPPPAYSEDPASEFYKQALEVRDAVKNLDDERKAIARFWSDDPMLSPTPPGHWMWIAMQIFEKENTGLEKSVEVLARLGMAISDGFIACWKSKFEYDLVRPVTYIKRVIDKTWEPLLITPPFPEYPSGHSTQSGAAAAALAKDFGDSYAFTDATHVRDGLAPRSFKSFEAAAQEAALSRLYGGIHFRAAIDMGLEQGKCVGKFVNMLQTRVA
jgi:hypothetical protein